MEDEKRRQDAGDTLKWHNYAPNVTLMLCIVLLLCFMAEQMKRGNQSFAFFAVLITVLLVLCLFMLWSGLLDPLRRIIRYLRDGTKPDAGPDGLSGPAAEVWAQLQETITETKAEAERIRQEAGTIAARERQAAVAEEMASYSPPEELEMYSTRNTFDLSGKVWPGQNAQAYDAFFADQGLLCVLLGQAEEGSVAGAMLLAQVLGSARALLRTGHTLEESMADAHRFCARKGKTMRLQAMTLNLTTGLTELFCAGTEDPALMRFEENSAWCGLASAEPLGSGQSRLFRPNQLRLKNGDILMLYAEENQGFSKQRLREILNRCQSEKTAVTTDMILRRTEEALAERTGTYTAVALQFFKPGRNELACVVPAVPESFPSVLDYLKKSSRQYGITRRASAFIAVASEELFMLCCRAAAGDQELRVLYSVAQDGGAATLCIEGDFQGINPLSQSDGDPSGAVNFICSQSDYQQFKQLDGMDAVTIVFFPEPDEIPPR